MACDLRLHSTRATRLHSTARTGNKQYIYIYIENRHKHKITIEKNPESTMTKQSLNNILKFFIQNAFFADRNIDDGNAVTVCLTCSAAVFVSVSQHHIHQWPETTVIHSVLYCLSLRITLYLVLYSIPYDEKQKQSRTESE